MADKAGSVSQAALALFELSLEHPTANRRAWLSQKTLGQPELAAAVDRLVNADGGEHSFLDHGITSGADLVGQKLGSWRVDELLAEGGMGSVYRVHREDGDFQQRAALKVIRGQLFQAPQLIREQLLARFQVERQVLANIQHDNVAGILDGGSTSDGLPYLVMEFIEGEPLNDYVRKRRLSLRQRLDLFMHLLDAMGAVHANLVVHRDLKPSNVMVTDAGEVKLLDFGIAKVLDTDAPGAGAYTMTGASAMTPDYASPEQVRGEPVTLASDIYSLGLLLYQLLGGSAAYEVSQLTPAEAERIICEDEPTLPSSSLRQSAPTHIKHGPADLRGDLDAIIMKALRKEPALRYGSSFEMAADIERFLSGLPVRARRNSRRYRLGKFLLRNRGLLAATGAVVAALGVGLLLAFGQARKASAAAADARSEAAKAEAVSEFLLDLISQGDPFEAPQAPTVRDVLETAGDQVGDRFVDHPEVEAAVRRTLGWTLVNLGKLDLAEPQLTEAYEKNLAAHGLGHPSTILNQSNLGWLAHEKDQLPEARRWYDLAISGFGPDTPKLLQASVLNDYGVVLGWYEENAASAEALHRAQAILDEVDPSTPKYDPAMVVGNLAVTTHQLGDLEQAEAYYLEDIRLKESRPGSPDANLMYSYNNLATLKYERKEIDEALPLMERSIALRRDILGPEHPSLGRALGNLALVNLRADRLDEAEAAVREAETVNASQPPSSDTRLRLRLTVARIRHARGDLEQALEDSQALLADLGAIDHREVGEVAAQVHLHVALVHADRQELEAASSAAAQAVALRTALHGEDHYLTQEATKLLRKYQDGEPQGG
ncbi:MAG: serine/threonine-protein kinase [Pseudomonadota bacterium]